MNDPITLHIHRDTDYRKDARGVTVEKESLTAYITDEHIRAIVERTNAMGLLDAVIEESLTTDKPTAPMSFANYPIKGWTDKPASPADASDLLSAGQVVAGPTPYVVTMVQGHPTLKVGDVVRMGDTGSPKHDNYLIRDDFSLHAIADEHDQYVLLKRWQPSAPVDDKATVDALIRHGMHDGGLTPRGLIAAIRRGEVPGLTTMESLEANKFMLRVKMRQVQEERDTLKSEVERLRAEASNHAADAETVRRERDAAIARAEKMARAMRVQTCPDCDGEGYLGRCINGKLQSCEYCGGHEDALGRGFLRYDPPELIDETEKQRDTARAAHAEAMELLREVRGPSPLTEYGLDELRSRIDAHLAKHGGGK